MGNCLVPSGQTIYLFNEREKEENQLRPRAIVVVSWFTLRELITRNFSQNLLKVIKIMFHESENFYTRSDPMCCARDFFPDQVLHTISFLQRIFLRASRR